MSNTLVSPREELLSWIRDSVHEAFSGWDKESLFVNERNLYLEEIPLWVFDSTVKDLHFFAQGKSYLLGIGVAKEWTFSSQSNFGKMEAALRSISQEATRENWLFGGWSFPPPIGIQQTREEQQTRNKFSHSNWVIPALTFITKDGREGRLVLSISHDTTLLPRAEVTDYYERLASVLVSTTKKSSTMPLPTQLKDIPSRKRWMFLVRNALDSISKGELKKVVLARSTKILFNADIPLSFVLRNLFEFNPHATIFGIKKADTVFMGATPENLLTVRDREIVVDCLAASAPRGHDRSSDDLLGQELLTDRKSCYEQQLVVEQVARALSEICYETTVSGSPILKKLPNIQHLHSTVKGQLRPTVSIWSAAQKLWPTPATGGEPREAAIRWIRQFEGIERGLYSGVLGYMNASGDHGKLVVSIRSGLIRGNSAVLFAGSGIVPGSDPQKEFEETGWKMETMKKALGL